MMKIPVVLAIVALLVVLRVRRASLLVWTIAIWLSFYVGLRFGFAVPIPASVISIYMGVATLSLLAYVTSDRERMRAVTEPLVRLMTERRFLLPLAVLVLAIPTLLAASIYVKMSAPVEPPFFARTIHPAPPSEVPFADKPVNLITAENPYRALETADPAAFKAHLENGRRVYYQNCVFCHGDNLAGNGMYIHGLNPIPTNFTDSGTIAMLEESFLFWRIAKGGPGMPEEGGPWDTAMPAWEKFLTEEEVWDVILFLYDFTGYKPRAREGHEEHP